MARCTAHGAGVLFLACGLAVGPAALAQEGAELPRTLLLAEARLNPGSGSDAAQGPDVIVGELSDVFNGGSLGGIQGYAVGTTSCNIGTQNVLWVSSTNQHPVIGQNMYKLKDGRMRQIGQSWLKHGFTALAGTVCATCAGPSGSVLGVGCSDPYSGSLNAGQTRLGPRSDINPTTGFYPYPYTIAFQQTGDAIYKRLQVAQADVQDSTALYFVEGHYITADDAQAGNGLNNAAYRRVTINPANNYNATMQGVTYRTRPAIFAWKDHGLGIGAPDPAVTIVAADYVEQGQTARFWVGAKATDLGNGSWRYDYAIQNINSHRAAGSFTIPLAGGVTVTDTVVACPPYHSGEPYSNTPWAGASGGEAVSFEAPQKFEVNANANAIRWGTMHNFSFVAGAAPRTGIARIGLFRPGGPGEPDSVSVMLPVPGTGACYADCDNSGATLDVADFTCFLQKFAAADPYANCDGSTLPPLLNVADFTCFLQSFAGGCE